MLLNCSDTAWCVVLPQACQLPLFSYIVERLCACCYEQAWYAKLGGVVSIKFLMERLPLTWVLQNQQTFLKALLFVMMDLTGEVRDRKAFLHSSQSQSVLESRSWWDGADL
jgi:hypothetical protein